MQTIAISNLQTEKSSSVQTVSFTQRLQRMMTAAEENRFGVVATLILLQVTVAGFNVVIPPMIGASVYLMAPGIILAFLSNGLALAQAKMNYVLVGFALSMVINAVISVYCFMQL